MPKSSMTYLVQYGEERGKDSLREAVMRGPIDVHTQVVSTDQGVRERTLYEYIIALFLEPESVLGIIV